MYYVYLLKDYRFFYFYIGLTKNLDIRIREHTQCKGNNPAKNYRVRKTITTHGSLLYDVEEYQTEEEALVREAFLIKKYKHQLVNVQHGKNGTRPARTRKTGRSKQCKTCGNWYKRLDAHVCGNQR